MTPIEVILGIALIAVGVIAFLAHRDGLTFKQEVAKDQAVLRNDVTKGVSDLQAKVLLLEHKTSTPAAAPSAPLVTQSPGTS